jgi:hypothetical protein
MSARFESEREKERGPHLGPSLGTELGDQCADASALRETDMIKFAAHATGMPSSGVSTISVSSPRIVRVTGAATISPSWSMTASLVSRSTGRRLSGGRNVYQRISPRFIRELVPAFALPPQRILGVRELTLGDWSTRVALCVAGAADDDHLDDLAFHRRDARDGHDAFADPS